jgi:histidine triad (HIT) family protein
MPENCVFCKILSGELPASFIYQDDELVVFKDIRPKAAVHLLVVPRLHIKSLNEVQPTHGQLLNNMLMLLPKLAHEQGLDNGYRMVCNVGRGGGQEVDHLHFHLLGGEGRLPGF